MYADDGTRPQGDRGYGDLGAARLVLQNCIGCHKQGLPIHARNRKGVHHGFSHEYRIRPGVARCPFRMRSGRMLRNYRARQPERAHDPGRVRAPRARLFQRGLRE